ncbi:phage tail tape measure protein [Muribacter muris]|uniref:phage tail tape measure protein n=1 Tax=Muribacter muris TaxID=67855 RepID=UPI00069F5FC4|nr:phage tail tape measure protein [Muribacter muris]
MAERKGLDYVINLIDQVTKPVQSIAKEIDALGQRGKAAMEQIAYGAAGVVAAGMAMKSALGPAIDMANAVSNIAATGMSEEGLAKVQKFALGFSSIFGVAATDVIDSANEIVRAIDGLTDDEVIAFTKSSNILAKATGSNVQQMGSYISQLYGIFGEQANAMGKSKWVEMVAAQATLTANKFKSSGESLQQAFTNLGSSAKDHGINIAEQFAVLGNLQNVFEGGLAGTKYAAFLNGAMKAQKKLGLSFVDANGKMLPMIKILQKIKAKFGDLDSKELYVLQKAFGTKEAAQVINNLLPKMDSLQDNITEISKANNLDEAIAISKTVTDVWERFANILINIRTIIGGQVLAKITPFLNKIADAGTYFVKWLEVNPNIARLLGYIVGLSLALGAVVPAVMLIVGIFKLWKIAGLAMLIPFKLIKATLFGILKLIGGTFLSPIKLAGAGAEAVNILSGKFLKLAFNTTILQYKWQNFLALFDTGLGAIILGLRKLTLKNISALFDTGLGKIVLVFRKLSFYFALFPTLLKTSAGSFKAFFNPLNLVNLLAVGLKGSIIGLFTAIKVGISFIFSPLMLISGLIIGLSIFIYKFRAELSAFFQGVISGFTQWGVSLEPVKQALGRVWNIILGVVAKISEMLGLSTAGSQDLEKWASAGEAVGAILAAGFQLAIDALALVIDLVGLFGEGIVEAIFTGVEMWQNFFEKISNGDVIGAFMAIGEGIWKLFTGVFKKLYEMALKTINWIIEKINQFTGTDFKPITIPVELDMPTMPVFNSPQNVVGSVSATALKLSNTALQTAPIPQPNTKLERGKTVSNMLSQSTKNITQHNNITINGSGLNEQQMVNVANRIVKENTAMGS